MALTLVFNVFTSTFDYVDIAIQDPGFSWYYIPVGTNIIVDTNREMVTTSPQTILGILTALGRNTVL